MVEVNLWAGLRAFTDGKDKVAVEADTVGEMLDALARAYPGLEDIIEEGVSVAVDGRVIHSSLTEKISADSEVFLMQRVKGG